MRKITFLTRFTDYFHLKRCYTAFLMLCALSFVQFGYSQTGTIGIGSGTANSSANIPVTAYYGYTYSQQIVKASEYATGGGVAGNITKIRFYVSNASATISTWNNWTVYLGHTSKTSFSSSTDWEPVANLTQVFTGTVTPVDNSWMEITLTTPFNYDATSNLIVAVDENAPSYSNSNVYFGSYTGASNTGIYYRSDSNNPDPASPPSGTRTATLARIQFEGTLASCLPPTGLVADNTDFTNGSFSFTAPQVAPSGYDYYVSTTNTAPTAVTDETGSLPVTSTSYNLSGLTANTNYYIWVRSTCSDSQTSSWVGPVSFYTGYCTPAPTSVDGSGITNVTMGTINNTTTGETGNYANYTTQSTSADAGSTVNFSITYATGYTYGTKIWVDWNNDADFDDDGEQVYFGLSTNANPTTLSGSFQVPALASVIGSHTMRIGGTDNDTGGTTCYAGAYGSYEDYTLVVTMPAAPVITGFTPASYCAADGVITITGTAIGNASLTIGGTAVPVTTNTTTQITANVPAGVSGVVSVTTVAGVATTVDTFSVATPAAFAISAASDTVCAGSNTVTVTVTEGLSSYDTYAWSPAEGVSGSAATGWVFNPTVTTEYVLTASQSAGPCVVNATFAVSVNPLPTDVTVTPATSEVCYNSVVALTGNGGVSAVPLTYCTPTVSSGGQSGDYINNFSFGGITNNGSGDTAADYTYYSALTATAVAGTDMTISLQAGSAYSQTFRVWIDLNQDGVFSDSESVYSTTTASTAVQTGTINIPTSAYNGTTRMRVMCKWNSASTATEGCALSGFGEFEDYNVTISGATDNVLYTWAPVAGLYADAAATQPYTGQLIKTVYALATADATYTATATNTDGCTASGQGSYSVIITPAPTGASTQVLCAGSPVGDVVAEGTSLQYYTTATGGTAIDASTVATVGSYYISQTANGCESTERLAVFVALNYIDAPTVENSVVTFCNTATVADLSAEGTDVKWYATATGGDELSADAALAVGTNVYYASQTVNGCESQARAAVSVTLNVTAAPAAQTDQVFCNSAMLSDIAIEGDNIMWYTTAEGGEALTADAALETGVYFASQTINGCTSATRTQVNVTVNVTPAPEAGAEQVFCNAATVASIDVVGTDVQWYTTAEGGEALAADAALESGVYYASQTLNGCESATRTAVGVIINAVMVPAVADVLACDSFVLPELPEGVAYYTAAQGGGDMIAAGTEITETTLLYVFAQVGECTAEANFVVTINETPVISAESPQSVGYTGTVATVADIVVTSNADVTWYASEEDAMTGSNALTADAEIQAGATYYAAASNGFCVAYAAVEISELLGNDKFDARSFSYYPNPVNGELNIKYSTDITSVEVYNLLGQLVLTTAPNATAVKVDTNKLAEGTYVVTVKAGAVNHTFKIVKKQ
ncbi:GEVED domain-containing protein [Flavobacterium sp. RHBU_3]|uniref:GEVED domain-containing protein n=1 Tax=Flavobacterium sp. RHBU_3 TaxID=3391184 RepID=UPI0039854BC3